MISMNLDVIAILRICGADYCCIINEIRKKRSHTFIKNVDLSDSVLKKHYPQMCPQEKKGIQIYKL